MTVVSRGGIVGFEVAAMDDFIEEAKKWCKKHKVERRGTFSKYF